MSTEANKLDKIGEKLDRLEVSFVAMAKDVEYHIRRTDMAENRVELAEKRLALMEDRFSNIRGFFMYAGLTLGALSTILGIVASLWKFFI